LHAAKVRAAASGHCRSRSRFAEIIVFTLAPPQGAPRSGRRASISQRFRARCKHRRKADLKNGLKPSFLPFVADENIEIFIPPVGDGRQC